MLRLIMATRVGKRLIDRVVRAAGFRAGMDRAMTRRQLAARAKKAEAERDAATADLREALGRLSENTALEESLRARIDAMEDVVLETNHLLTNEQRALLVKEWREKGHPNGVKAIRIIVKPRAFFARYLAGGLVGDSWEKRLDATDAGAAWTEMRETFPSTWAVYAGQVVSRQERDVDGERLEGPFRNESGRFFPGARRVARATEFDGQTPTYCKEVGAEYAIETRCGWHQAFHSEDVAEGCDVPAEIARREKG